MNTINKNAVLRLLQMHKKFYDSCKDIKIVASNYPYKDDTDNWNVKITEKNRSTKTLHHTREMVNITKAIPGASMYVGYDTNKEDLYYNFC